MTAPSVVAATPDPATSVHDALAREIGWVGELLASSATEVPLPGPSRPDPSARLAALAQALELTRFERDTLLLVAAVELDAGVAAQVAERTASGDPRPTFGLALAVLADGHWDALSPTRPLRRWQLVQLGEGHTLATRRLQLDETVLHHLTGIAPGPGRLRGTVVPVVPVELAPSQRTLADDLARAIGGDPEPLVVHLDGDDAAAGAAVAARVAERLAGPDGRAELVEVAALPAPGAELDTVATLIDRRARLSGSVPIVHLPVATGTADPAATTATALVAALSAPVVLVVGPGVGPVGGRAVRYVTVEPPPAAERRRLWHDALAEIASDHVATGLTRAADDLAHQHRLGAAQIRAVVRQWHTAGRAGDTRDPAGAGRLRALARQLTRTELDHLAQRIEVRADWDDLVLPAGHLQVLRDLVRQVRQRARVHDDWGFATRPGVAAGITALFAGASGTGKTLAAEVIAGELALDLYRVDLSTTVSKYIGETEKNLSRIFAAAEASGAVLLFDEADALFGRRGEVRDGHDRYANLEVAYLLQRMEAYDGLAILTTNLRGNLDQAFLRRLRVVLTFPFPDETQRAAIWRRAFPAATPTEDLDPDRLARVALTGGSIAAIALSAAFAAADEGTAVTTRHLSQAAGVDAAKHDRALTDTERAALS